MDKLQYPAHLEKKLIEQFKEAFKEKLGYEPVVITKTTDSSNEEKVPLMSLEVLKQHFSPFLPQVFTRTINLESKYRKRELVELRNIYCYLAKQMGYSLKTIGDSIGNRDHTTIIHNITSFKNLMETNDTFREKYTTIINFIKSYYEPSALDNIDQVQRQPEPALFSRLLQVQDSTDTLD